MARTARFALAAAVAALVAVPATAAHASCAPPLMDVCRAVCRVSPPPVDRLCTIT